MPKNPALLAQKLEGIFIVKIRFYGMEEFCLVGGLVYILLQSVRLFMPSRRLLLSKIPFGTLTL